MMSRGTARRRSPAIDDCWNRIGVRGDRSCPGADAARALPQLPGVLRRRPPRCSMRDAPAGYLADWTAHFARADAAPRSATRESVVIFRIGAEWLALPTAVGRAKSRTCARFIRCRTGASGVVLGLANVRGELLVCVSLRPGRSALEPPSRGQRRATPHGYQRLLVIRRDGVRAVCPVDEVHGIHRFHPRELEGGAGDRRQGHGHLLDGAAAVARPLGRPARRPAAVLHAEAEPRMSAQDLSQLSMLDLFRVEAETPGAGADVRPAGARARSDAADQLEACMRAAHSLKGAARIVGLDAGVRVAHAMEDCFVAAQQGRIDAAARRTSTCCSAASTCWRASPTPPEAELGALGRRAESRRSTRCLAALGAHPGRRRRRDAGRADAGPAAAVAVPTSRRAVGRPLRGRRAPTACCASRRRT